MAVLMLEFFLPLAHRMGSAELFLLDRLMDLLPKVVAHCLGPMPEDSIDF